MNILDTLQEVWTTLSAHPLRTMLTALSVAWGIFMLVILLAAGDGLSKGATHQFRDDAVNSLWIYGGTTQKPFDGYPVNRKIVLNNDDYDLLSREIEGIEHITSRFYFNYRSMQISHGDRRGAFDIRASHPDHQFIEMSNITEGRFLNDLDIRDARKVAVIGVDVVKPLFGDEEIRWVRPSSWLGPTTPSLAFSVMMAAHVSSVKSTFRSGTAQLYRAEPRRSADHVHIG